MESACLRGSKGRRENRTCVRLNSKDNDEADETAWDTFRYRQTNHVEKSTTSNGGGKGRTSTSNWNETWSDTAFPRYLANYSANNSCEEIMKKHDKWDWGYINGEKVSFSFNLFASFWNIGCAPFIFLVTSLNNLAQDIFNPVWDLICEQAEQLSSEEPLLSSFLYSAVLAHDTFEKALANVLANRVCDGTLLPTQLFPTFLSILEKDDISKAAMLDIQVIKDRDPACQSFVEALLYYKGFHALQLHRIAHDLFHTGHEVMAYMLQSRCSEVLGVDIHPAANIGKGILVDHATGIVIGETAHVGDYSSILQGVTLGGTGKASGDRHPKVGKNVLIGAQATILGNISIGEGSMIAAGSVVLKDVPYRSMIAGIPAQVVGSTCGTPSMTMQQDGWNFVSDQVKNDDDLADDIEYYL